MADRERVMQPAGGGGERYTEGNGSHEKNVMMVNGSNLALHHNAHFSDKEDSVGPYEGGAAAHGSSGKKKN
jgi:hypothetical protein